MDKKKDQAHWRNRGSLEKGSARGLLHSQQPAHACTQTEQERPFFYMALSECKGTQAVFAVAACHAARMFHWMPVQHAHLFIRTPADPLLLFSTVLVGGESSYFFVRAIAQYNPIYCIVYWRLNNFKSPHMTYLQAVYRHREKVGLRRATFRIGTPSGLWTE